MKKTDFITETQDGTIVKAAIHPRASKTQIVGLHGNTVKIKVTAPPVGGAANEACCRFLAKQLGINPSHVTILTGATSRTKKIKIQGLTSRQVRRLLLDQEEL